MKETVITPGRKRRELYIALACFIVAYAMNVAGIIKYHTPAKELLTKIPLVLLITLMFYVALSLLRLLYAFVAGFWNRK